LKQSIKETTRFIDTSQILLCYTAVVAMQGGLSCSDINLLPPHLSYSALVPKPAAHIDSSETSLALSAIG
jgi:hypothetical protein